MIHIAIPCHGRWPLTRCAIDALRRTVKEPYRLWVIENDDPLLRGERLDPKSGSYANGRKLQVILAALPTDATWLFAMHNDSAPLMSGWLDWLMAHVGLGVAGGFLGVGHAGLPHPSGALYRVEWLRDTHASFLPHGASDVGAGLTVPVTADTFIAQQAVKRPWWLRRSNVAMVSGCLGYAHLGGGTIGATSRPLPWWWWPTLVRRHLDRHMG